MNGSARNMQLHPDSETKLEDNHNTDHSIYLTSYDLYYLNQIKTIRMSLPWIIVTFGLIGNLFILTIFIRKNKKFTSNGFCFCALAISDSCALLFMLMRSMLQLQIVSNVSATCKIIKYIYHVSLQISSWCLVLLTIDRLIAILFIFKYNTWCKKWHAVKFLIAFIVTIILTNLHLLIFVTSGVYKDPYRTTTTTTTRKVYHHGYIPRQSLLVEGPVYICNVNQNEYPIYYKYFYSKWDIYHALIYGIVPFVIILGSNILIILKLTVLKQKTFFKSNLKQSASMKSLDKLDPSFKSFQITLMLLSIAFVFLLFTSPISIYMAVFYDNLKSVRDSKKEYIKVVLRYVAYFNNAINFYVYIIFSSEFRKEFVKTIKSCFRIKSVTSSVGLCTRSTSMGSNNMLPQLEDDPYVRKTSNKKPRLELKKEDSSDYPFLNPFNTKNYVDAAELYKNNNSNAKLTFYKRNESANQTSNVKEPFISSQPTLV